MTNHVQNHIHVSDALGAAPENAPSYSFVVNDRIRIPVIPLSLRRSKTFKLFPNVLRDDSAQIVNLTNFKYKIRVEGDDPDGTEVLIDTIQSWIGKKLYVVDSFHPNDGTDHTPAVKRMVLSDLADGFKTDDWGLLRYFVTLSLEDARL